MNGWVSLPEWANGLKISRRWALDLVPRLAKKNVKITANGYRIREGTELPPALKRGRKEVI